MDRNLIQGSVERSSLQHLVYWKELNKNEWNYQGGRLSKKSLFLCALWVWLGELERERMRWERHLGGYNHQPMEEMLRTWNVREGSCSLAGEGWERQVCFPQRLARGRHREIFLGSAPAVLPWKTVCEWLRGWKAICCTLPKWYLPILLHPPPTSISTPNSVWGTSGMQRACPAWKAQWGTVPTT